MQTSPNNSVAIVSVLKPVDDTRMYEKFGATLSGNGFQVHIVGQPGSAQPSEGIAFHTFRPFGRLSLRRLFIGWKIFFILQRIRPTVIIITTPELLWVGVLQKIFMGRELYYDVWENYYWNILDGNTYPIIIRSIVASFVRFSELLATPFIDKFFLAEKRYVSELRFAKPSVILENKLPKVIASGYPPLIPKKGVHLLFTGTLAENTGVFKAIEIATRLHELDPNIHLTIAGYCHLPGDRKRLYQETNQSFIDVVGGDKLVPHSDILKLVATCDFGLVIYPPSLGTFTSIPTKLFEYLALQLPILIRHNPESHEIVEQHNAGIILSSAIDYDKLLFSMKSQEFKCTQSDDIFWESGADSLISAIR